jgi:hypothetical protein
MEHESEKKRVVQLANEVKPEEKTIEESWIGSKEYRSADRR